MSPDIGELNDAWPALVWTLRDKRGVVPADDGERAAYTGTSKGGAIVVGLDFVEVYVQGIPGPAKSHDGTIEGVQRAVRASLGEVDAVIALLDPARAVAAAALNERAHDLANEVQALRSLVDEAIDNSEVPDETIVREWLGEARKARAGR